MTRFCLIRHGQTDWNIEGRYQGQSDVPLNENGRTQAQNLAQELRGQKFAAIYSSDLSRAKETAEIVAVYQNLPVLVDTRLREINQGEWEGQLVDVIKERYAELWRQSMIDPATVRPPGGETVAEVASRMVEALSEMAQLYPNKSVLIASHGLALATILCKIQGIPLGQAYRVIPDNAEPVWVSWSE